MDTFADKIIHFTKMNNFRLMFCTYDLKSRKMVVKAWLLLRFCEAHNIVSINDFEDNISVSYFKISDTLKRITIYPLADPKKVITIEFNEPLVTFSVFHYAFSSPVMDGTSDISDFEITL